MSTKHIWITRLKDEHGYLDTLFDITLDDAMRRIKAWHDRPVDEEFIREKLDNTYSTITVSGGRYQSKTRRVDAGRSVIGYTNFNVEGATNANARMEN